MAVVTCVETMNCSVPARTSYLQHQCKHYIMPKFKPTVPWLRHTVGNTGAQFERDPCWKGLLLRGLQLVDEPCWSKETPEGTVATGWPMLEKVYHWKDSGLNLWLSLHPQQTLYLYCSIKMGIWSQQSCFTSAWGLLRVLWVASFRKLQNKCSWITCSWIENGNFGKKVLRCLFSWTELLLFSHETQCATLWLCVWSPAQ